MVESNTDILWDEKINGEFYTTCGNITHLPDVEKYLDKLIKEWNARKEFELWTDQAEEKYGN